MNGSGGDRLAAPRGAASLGRSALERLKAAWLGLRGAPAGAANEERLRLALDVGRIGTWDWNLRTGEVNWSDLHYTLLGYRVGEVTPNYEVWAARVHPEDLPGTEDALQAAMRSREIYAHTFRQRHPDGTVVWVEALGRYHYADDGTAVRMIGVIHDITRRKLAEDALQQANAELERRIDERTGALRREMAERKRVEEQLLQSQKLEALGRLTGGIAHDLNNKFQIIGANVDAVVKQLKDQPQLRRGLLSALVATDRASTLLSRLLTFSRRQDIRPEAIDVAGLLSSVGGFLDRSLLGDAITIAFDLDEDLWPVLADVGEFEAAMINLAVNARDAMPNGGVIRIAARNVPGPEAPAVAEPLGNCVRISVEDTGEGIPPEDLARVFEPFFTTKGIGKGTGLGLSQVYGFARQLGGHAEIASTVGRGTTVSVFLPRAEIHGRIGPRPAPDEGADELPAAKASGEILVVDDEVEVAAALGMLLAQLGYDVCQAGGAEAALALIEERRPDLVLLDISMPGGLNGVELARDIRTRMGDLPILLITGNPLTLAGAEDFPVVLKPITSDRLNEAIRRQLGTGSGAVVLSLATGRARLPDR